MARIELHKVKNNWYALLDGGISDSDTSVVIDGAGAGAEPATPFYFDIGTEILRCSAVATNTPTAGKSTLTVTRAHGGTVASSHSDNEPVQQQAYATQWTELQNRIAWLELATVAMLGGGSGVVRTSASGNDLLVAQQGSPDMTVLVTAGAAVVSGQPTALTANESSATITAPSTNPRIDIVQLSQEGAISIKAGTEAGSPSAPSVDANNLKLAEIALATTTTAVTTGLITDSRVYL